MSMVEIPWSCMHIPKGDGITTLRVKESLNNWYWICCRNGQFGIAIQVPIAEIDKIYSIQKTSKLDIIFVKETHSAYLGIVISASELNTVFYRLCLDLISACQFSTSSSEIIIIIKRRVSAWQKLFEKEKNILTPEVCLGLISELKFLREHWVPAISTNGVLGWQGPNGAYQDFYDGDLRVSVEIKTHAFDSNIVKISSQEQLDVEGFLFLVAYPSSVSCDNTGITLNSYIEETRAILPNDQYTIFDERLLSVGYVKDDSYDAFSFYLGEAKAYRIKDGFPRLISTNLPNAIGKVKYELDLSYASDSVCLIDKIKEVVDCNG